MNNFWKNKKALVTGADGFIGSHLVEELVRKGAIVKAFAYYNSFAKWGWLDTLKRETLDRIQIFPGDIRDYGLVCEAAREQEIVFHLASLIGIPYSYHAPESYVDTNVKGTLNVLNACKNSGVSRLVHTSTSEIYGTALYAPIDEKHPLQPQSPYSASKIAADNLAQSYYHTFNLPVAILRPFNTFGPRQSARAVIPTIISQIYSGKKKIELGDIKNLRDFNYVKNTVDAFMALAESRGVEGEVFNAGSEREISIENLVKLIASITGKDVEIVEKKERLRPEKSEVKRLLADCRKIREKCGWKPEISLEQGLKLTCKWIEENLDSYKSSIYNI